MSYLVYILYSQTVDKYYVGQSNDIEERLTAHHNNTFAKAYTRISKDWEVVFEIKCVSRSVAIRIEGHIKSMRSRKYIENLIQYPEMTEKLLVKYNE